MAKEKKRKPARKKHKGRLRPGSRKRNEAIQQVRRLIGKNYSDDEICEQMGINSNTLFTLKQEILSTDRTLFQHLDNAGVYSDYLMKSRQMVKKLHGMQVKFNNRGQWTALVAAIKQEKEIYDSCIKFGQDFGFIDKKAAELEVKGEMTFSNASAEEMKQEIEQQVKQMNQLAQGKPIPMREELIGAVNEKGDDVTSYVPENMAEVPKKAKKPKQKTKKKKKSKVKTKLRLRKNV